MYGEPQAFGHFGVPDQLNPNYGVDQMVAPEGGGSDDGWTDYGPTLEQAGKTLSSDGTATVDVTKILTSGYKRNDKRLPFIKGGATDAGVKSQTGIHGLISEIQASMGIPQTGSITDAEIKSFQKKKGLKQDGVIGKASYTKLGFTAPFPKSSSGGSSYNPKTDAKLAIAEVPFYKKKWVQYTALGVVVVATLGVLFYPKGDE